MRNRTRTVIWKAAAVLAAVIAVGAAMVVYGLGTALSIRLTRWGK